MNTRLNAAASEKLFENLIDDFVIYAPTIKKNKGRFSDTDITTYDRVNSLAEIDFVKNTQFSPKGVLFPPRETLFTCDSRGLTESIGNEYQIIVLLRSCDIHALKVLDTMFLKNGGFRDTYYENKRNRLKVFLIECAISFPECFCVSMGTNKTEDYDVLIRPEDDGLSLKIKDSSFEKYFSKLSINENIIQVAFPTKDPFDIEIPESVDDSIFTSSLWNEYSKRCIACGRCNISCPTCTCFTIQNIVNKDTGTVNERRRIWSACQVKEFGIMAGNHDIRLKHGEKMRYKILHKIVDFKKRSGFNMCIGCGRCDLVCPEYISMRRSIEKINDYLKSESIINNG